MVSPRGENGVESIGSPSLAPQIRRMLSECFSVRKIAAILEIHRAEVSRIKRLIHEERIDRSMKISAKLKGEFASLPARAQIGRCQCGCGQRTRIGLDGNFAKFRQGHQWLLRRRETKPEGWVSSYELLQKRWEVGREVAKVAKKIANLERPTFQDLRKGLNGKAIIFDRPVSTQGMSRMITTHLGDFVRRPIAVRTSKSSSYLPEIRSVYPYIANRELDGSDLVWAVNDLIPPNFNIERRSDLAQNILLEIISGRIRLQDVSAQMPMLLENYWKQFGTGHLMTSLDAQREYQDADSTSLHELIDGQKALSRLYGGTNYETQSVRWERVEEWDGKICARY